MATEGSNSRDLRATLALSQEEASNGTTRLLNLPGGRQLPVSVPAGIREGQVIRLAGQGYPAGAGQPAGDLILTVAIIAAKNREESAPSSPEEFAPTYPATPPPPPTPLPANAGSGPYPPLAARPTPNPTPANMYPGPVPYTPYTAGQDESLPDYLKGTYPAASTQQAAPYSPYPQSQPGLAGAAQSGQPGVATKRRSTAITMLIAGLVVLVILASIFVYYIGVYVPHQKVVQATATAVAQVTATGQANARATVQAQGTANAQASATATVIMGYQDQYTQITSGTPALTDALSAPDTNNWDTGDGCTFTNGAYHVSEATKGFFLYCTAESTNFDNFAYQVQMTIIKGDYGGVTFRENRAKSQFYILRIGQDGSYSLYYYPDNTAQASRLLIDGTSNLIKTGANQSNLITVIARGSTINLYVNNSYLTNVSDSSLTSGQIGVIADDTANPAEVVYSQVKVWKL